ncbi:MAG TPA: HEAT repeat domain-containing protein [Gemmataceae bacterium]|jgi:HEAT repeat protein
MVGLSQRLTSLVKAAPQLVPYTLAFLGRDLPLNRHPDHGFTARVQDLRKQIATNYMKYIASQTKLSFVQEGNQLQEIAKEQLEDSLLEIGEKMLTMKLFQTSSVTVFLRQLSVAKPEELQKQIASKDPLVRFLVINTIRRRFLHMEPELIACLKDPSPTVREAAHSTLSRIAHGTDFGPTRGASLRGIERSIQKWTYWNALQKSESPETLAKQAAIYAAGKRKLVPPLENAAVALVADDTPELIETATWSKELVNTRGEKQIAVLARLRDSKNVNDTFVLALTIPKLTGDIQYQARAALRQRLEGQSIAILRDSLQDDDIEVRRAAALACGNRGLKEHIADLLQLLDDPEPEVVQSARVALTQLTGQDFGPATDAGRRNRDEAVAAWHKWWKEHQDK